jgi:hypothetical protein
MFLREERKAVVIHKNLMSGLDEVDAFLAGETAGYKVTLPSEVDCQPLSERGTEAFFDALVDAPKPNARPQRAFCSARKRVRSR